MRKPSNEVMPLIASLISHVWNCLPKRTVRMGKHYLNLKLSAPVKIQLTKLPGRNRFEVIKPGLKMMTIYKDVHSSACLIIKVFYALSLHQFSIKFIRETVFSLPYAVFNESKATKKSPRWMKRQILLQGLNRMWEIWGPTRWCLCLDCLIIKRIWQACINHCILAWVESPPANNLRSRQKYPCSRRASLSLWLWCSE